MAKTRITTYAGLQEKLNSITAEVMLNTSNYIAELLRKNLDTLWYKAYEPRYYERTNQVLDSISNELTGVFGNQTSVRIYFDWQDKIIANEVSGSSWNQHMSLDLSDTWNGDPIPMLVIEWLEKGNNSSVYAYDGVGYFEKTLEEISSGGVDSGALSKKVIDFIKKEYRKFGIKIK